MKAAIPREEKLLILGNFNAHVGKYHETCDAISHFVIRVINSDWFRWLELCFEFNFSICNTLIKNLNTCNLTPNIGT